MTKKVSLKDIARKAGVSVTLVSYVLNNKYENRINEQTASRIRDTAARLKYRTNQIARSLKTSKTFTLGFIVANISNPFSASLARIIQDAADKQKYTVIFGSSDEQADKADRLINAFVTRQVDGLILSLPSKSEDLIRNLQKMNVPFILLDRYFPAITCSYIALDNYGAAREAVNHLIGTGRKRIGMITYQSDLFHLRERKRGYKAALRQHGIAYRADLVKTVHMATQEAEIAPAIDELLAVKGGVEAILFATNNIATGSLKHINQLSVKVPAQLALISFDQTPMLDLFYAPVSYIRQPLQEMGEMAIDMLLKQIADNKRVERINLKAELVIRKSTLAQSGK